jgi:arginyl-tRNA synthetase
MTIKSQIKNIISAIIGEEVEFTVEKPEISDYGDYAANIALILAKKQKKEPLEIAQQIKAKIKSDLFEKIEIVKPGFINFFLNPEILQKKLDAVLKEGEDFG